MPASISQFVLPVKDKQTGTVTNITFDVSGSGSSNPETIGFGYGSCNTAYITSEKAVSITDFVLKKNGIVAITFVNAVASSATLNINSLGAKPIYHRGAAITNNIIFAGDMATFIYDGTNFNLLCVDRLPVVNNDTIKF